MEMITVIREGAGVIEFRIGPIIHNVTLHNMRKAGEEWLTTRELWEYDDGSLGRWSMPIFEDVGIDDNGVYAYFRSYTVKA